MVSGVTNRRDLAQCRASKAVSTHREATPLIIRESQPSTAQLGTQDAILFDQIPDHVLLTSTEPASEGREEYLKEATETTTPAPIYSTDEAPTGGRAGRVLGTLRAGRYLGNVPDDRGSHEDRLPEPVRANARCELLEIVEGLVVMFVSFRCVGGEACFSRTRSLKRCPRIPSF
jgi:hypothetical protein